MRRIDVAPAALQCRHHFHLVVQFPRRGRIGNVAAVRDDRIRRLHEEHRVCAAHGLGAHFLRVVGVIAPDAIDAVHGEARAAAGDGQARNGGEVEHE